MRRPSPRAVRIVVWVAAFAWFGALSWIATENDARIEEESRVGREALCLAINNDRETIRSTNITFADVLIAASADSAERTPQEAARREQQAKAFRDRVVGEVTELTEPLPCHLFVENPDQFLRQEREATAE